jgi:hypothetical protein
MHSGRVLSRVLPRRGPISCPVCDSPLVKPARVRRLRERLFALLGYDCARCSACGHRFLASPIGHFESIAFAKCPKCLRMDLTTWDPKYYRPSAWMNLKLWFGAHCWRCEPCRTNFVSFRSRKEKYVRPGGDQDEDLLPI